MSSWVEKLRRPVGLALNFPLPMVDSVERNGSTVFIYFEQVCVDNKLTTCETFAGIEIDNTEEENQGRCTLPKSFTFIENPSLIIHFFKKLIVYNTLKYSFFFSSYFR